MSNWCSFCHIFSDDLSYPLPNCPVNNYWRNEYMKMGEWVSVQKGNCETIKDVVSRAKKEKDPNGVDPKEALASKKMGFDSIPITASLYLSQANQHGADKYGTYNWLELPDESMSLMTYINAIHRHWLLLRAGQDLTSDGQVHHFAAIMAGCAVALDAITFNKVKDDRVKLTEEQIKILEEMINNEK